MSCLLHQEDELMMSPSPRGERWGMPVTHTPPSFPINTSALSLQPTPKTTATSPNIKENSTSLWGQFHSPLAEELSFWWSYRGKFQCHDSPPGIQVTKKLLSVPLFQSSWRSFTVLLRTSSLGHCIP